MTVWGRGVWTLQWWYPCWLPLRLRLVLILYSSSSYACSWRRQNPCTDGLSGETKDLWVFYFTDLPDIADTLAKGLVGKYGVENRCALNRFYDPSCIHLSSGPFICTVFVSSGTQVYWCHVFLQWMVMGAGWMGWLLSLALCFIDPCITSLRGQFALRFIVSGRLLCDGVRICRSLITENFLPLGKWFVRPDSSVATDGR